jgi:hypothetical protein
VQEILELTKRESWRFCPGEKNPADLPSRGSNGIELTKNLTWWSGPEFLRKTGELWPTEPETCKGDDTKAFAEITKPKKEPVITRALVNVGTESPNVEAIMDCKRYSTKKKLLRVTALVKRFIDRLRKRAVPAELTAEELRAADKLWLISIQANSFENERSHLQGGLTKAPPLIRQIYFWTRKPPFDVKEELMNHHFRCQQSSPYFFQLGTTTLNS